MADERFETRIITRAQVAELLPMAACMDLMTEALAALARGDAAVPERIFMPVPGRGAFLLAMPAFLGQPPALALKAVTLVPGNAPPTPAIQGAVLLFDPDDGRLLAVIDANEITAIRTAAVSGVATRLLARPNAGDLAILGSGVQARTHLEAMRAARPIRRVRVWSRTPDHARAFAERASIRYGIPIEAVPSAREAVTEASIVCTVTASHEPVLRGEWLAPGTHLNAVGVTGSPTGRELDTATVARARLFVDSRVSARTEASEIMIARAEGAIGDDHVRAELGEVLLGRTPGRTSPQEITLFRSLGLAVEDAAAARYVYEQAVARGIGTTVGLGDGDQTADGRR